jgi:hypothetical protein
MHKDNLWHGDDWLSVSQDGCGGGAAADLDERKTEVAKDKRPLVSVKGWPRQSLKLWREF